MLASGPLRVILSGGKFYLPISLAPIARQPAHPYRTIIVCGSDVAAAIGPVFDVEELCGHWLGIIQVYSIASYVAIVHVGIIVN